MCDEFTKEMVQEKVDEAIVQLFHKDSYLLIHDVSERSITHKLACYLQEEFGNEWNVDCEYNRYHHKVKQIEFPIEDSPLATLANEANEAEDKKIYPDIIVHQRDTDNNLLVIEIKKDRSNNQAAENFDLEKLHILKTQAEFQYRFAYFLKLTTNTDTPKVHEDSHWI